MVTTPHFRNDTHMCKCLNTKSNVLPHSQPGEKSRSRSSITVSCSELRDAARLKITWEPTSILLSLTTHTLRHIDAHTQPNICVKAT